MVVATIATRIAAVGIKHEPVIAVAAEIVGKLVMACGGSAYQNGNAAGYAYCHDCRSRIFLFHCLLVLFYDFLAVYNVYALRQSVKVGTEILARSVVDSHFAIAGNAGFFVNGNSVY